jgi:hypothetical protein
MVRFQRPEEPAGFADHVKHAKEHLAGAVHAGRKLKTKEDFPGLWSDYKREFSHAQKGKCGFCERDVRTHWGDVEHYRPKNGLEELPEDPDERGVEDEHSGLLVKPRKLRWLFDSGYWWLAYEWRNYLLSCARCNRTWKRCLFPIAESPRSGPPEKGGAETPLLLNPFGPEDPAKHLAFTDLGTVEPRDGSPMGRATIDTCGLDQPPLVRSRAAVARRVKNILDDAELAETIEEQRRLRLRLLEMGQDDQPHAGMVRSIVEVEAGIAWTILEGQRL